MDARMNRSFERRWPRSIGVRGAVLAGAVLVAAGCGRGGSNAGVSIQNAVQSATTQVADTDADVTVALTTAEAATTSAAPTTSTGTGSPATTAAEPSTTSPVVSRGWQLAAPFDATLFPPFDESNWTGVPSPPLPTAPGQPLADGIYEAVVGTPWTATDPKSLDVIVHRLDPCTTLPQDACISFGDPYGPDELGVDDANPYPITIPLDSAVGVGMTGFECNPINKTGNGSDIAALFTAFDSAYAATLLPRLTAGDDQSDIINSIAATPAAGFSGSDTACGDAVAFGLVFHSGDAPPVLMQVLTTAQYDGAGNLVKNEPLTPTSAIHLFTIEVTGGVMTLYFYAGFFS